ncbi:hypothetical protein BSKO_00403 [Bryopsis sp. KO-2023]|nr:hypothetical protein BSKO_00403 [Bryopsis sp. KO-2023]
MGAEDMEAGSLDQWLVTFMEDNWVVLAIAVVVISVAQLYYFVTKAPSDFLHPDAYQDLPLQMKQNVNYNTLFLRFKLPEENQKLGLPVGQHVVFKFTDNKGKDFYRPYTPVSDVGVTGHVDFVIKVYPKGVMSQYIDKLDVGDRIFVKGPKGKFAYGRNMKKTLGMLCGGTGITPMYQVLTHILSDPNDKTRIQMIYANVTPDDILLQRDLDRLTAKHPMRFDVYYVIEKSAPDNWKGGVGYISKDMIKEHCPAPSGDIMMLTCGPTPMTDAMNTTLDEMGYTVDQKFKF